MDPTFFGGGEGMLPSLQTYVTKGHFRNESVEGKKKGFTSQHTGLYTWLESFIQGNPPSLNHGHNPSDAHYNFTANANV